MLSHPNHVMPVAEERVQTLAREAGASVLSVSTIDGALFEIARALREAFPVHRASGRLLMSDRQIKIVGIWSDGRTSLGVGTSMSVLSTSWPELIAGPTVVISRAPESLSDEVLRADGILSWTSILLRDAGSPEGMLSMSSRVDAAFQPDDIPFLIKLGEEVEAPLIALMRGVDSAR